MPRKPAPDEVARVMLRLAGDQARGGSIAPAEVAQALAEGDDDWRSYLPAVRQAAIGLARAGSLVILRKGKPADPDRLKGVYRIALPPDAAEFIDRLTLRHPGA